MSHMCGLTILCLTVFIIDVKPVHADGPENSVVRVFASLRMPNPLRPWTKQNAIEVMGTGVIIEGNRILTNAHVVLYASEVYVQAKDGGDRFDAKIASIGPEIDLATLVLDDASFFDKRPSMPKALKRPAANTGVNVMGFPAGGSGLSVTRGVISRIDYASYGGSSHGLRIHVDATVNPGGSGGPTIVDGKMVGLTYGRAQNIGYVIPNEEIDTYLEDVKDGHYDGKVHLTDHYQSAENEALRAKLGLKKTDRGLMVRESSRSDPAYPLKAEDVVTHVGDVTLDNEGMVEYENNLRLPFMVLIPRLAKDGMVPLRLIRKGKPMDIRLPVTREDNRLMKTFRGQYPSYFVHGPLVFSPVVLDAVPYYLQGNPFGTMGGPLETRDTAQVAFPGEELVVVTCPFLAHKIAKGYRDPFGQVISTVDGIKIKNLLHLVEVLRDGQGEFLSIEFHGQMTETLVFRRKAMEDATEQVISESGIPKRGTDNEMAVWKAKSVSTR